MTRGRRSRRRGGIRRRKAHFWGKIWKGIQGVGRKLWGIAKPHVEAQAGHLIAGGKEAVGRVLKDGLGEGSIGDKIERFGQDALGSARGKGFALRRGRGGRRRRRRGGRRRRAVRRRR